MMKGSNFMLKFGPQKVLLPGRVFCGLKRLCCSVDVECKLRYFVYEALEAKIDVMCSQRPGHNRKTKIGHGKSDGNKFYASATLNRLLLLCSLFAVVINASIIVKIFKWQKIFIYFALRTSHYRGQQTRNHKNCWFTVLFIFRLAFRVAFMLAYPMRWRFFANYFYSVKVIAKVLMKVEKKKLVIKRTTSKNVDGWKQQQRAERK